MFNKGKIKLDPALYDRAVDHASKAGYASVDEFVAHVLERELSGSGSDQKTKDKILEKMKGLGYMQ